MRKQKRKAKEEGKGKKRRGGGGGGGGGEGVYLDSMTNSLGIECLYRRHQAKTYAGARRKKMVMHEIHLRLTSG